MIDQKYFSTPMNQADIDEKKRRDRVVAIIGIVFTAITAPAIFAAMFASMGLFVLAFRWFLSLLGA